MIREGIYVMGMLGLTPYLQAQLMQKQDMSQRAASFYASVAGGILSAVPSHPFDIVKTCQQGDLDQRVYTSAWSTAKTLYKEEVLSRSI